ncbi:MAG: FAD binding domain-containing protein [Chloroflexi bacterium]|nr:FAD binding domain-containing protein [Chloroflexota bacterium]
MILEYHRPETIQDALALLARPGMRTLPLGGGTTLNRPSSEHFAVVDLQALRLNRLEKRGATLAVGATLTLHDLSVYAGLPAALTLSLQNETSFNLRQMATVAGTLVTAGGRSPFAVAMLAMDASLEALRVEDGGREEIGLGEFLLRRKELLPGRLITGVSIPLQPKTAYEVVARTPADQPVVCAAAAQWPSGRTRVALGGFGDAPALAMDGPEAGGADIAAGEAYSQAEDVWASAEYRREMAALLTRRCLAALGI